MYRAKILIVDDSEVGRNLLVGQLSRIGIAAEAVSSGSSALERLRHHDFDLVLMDIYMPDMDGIETTGLLRELQHKREIKKFPIVALTGGADKQSCITGGLDDYMTKPILVDELYKVVQRWLPRVFANEDEQEGAA
jgi:CheY-like chemotaxis protein